MRHARSLYLIAFVGLVAAPGCTHNYYYGNAVPVCEAPPVVGSVPLAYSYGEVCDVPTRVAGGTVVAEGSARAKPIVTVREPPARVVVSEPVEPRRRSTRVGWRGRDEVGGATTQISGAYEGDVIR